jgi:predicted dithiol-disulfide oxidoreductase (DUF899 family)
MDPIEKEKRMSLPEVVSPEEWAAARESLLAREKEATRARDALAAERRRQPAVEYRGGYLFEGPDGPATLIDMFDGRPQLIVYHFMFEPGGEPCGGCSMFTDNVGHLAHLNARDTTLALVSPAPQAEIQPFKDRMEWTLPWYSTADNGFNADCGVTTGFGLSVFLRDGDRALRTYFTSQRGVEALGSVWTFLDLTPFGRQESWEDSPAGRPQAGPYRWWRLHDEYEAATRP